MEWDRYAFHGFVEFSDLVTGSDKSLGFRVLGFEKFITGNAVINSVIL